MGIKETKNIGAFISYNNVNKPIEHPLIGLILLSALITLFFLRFSIKPPEQSKESLVWIVGLIVSMGLLISSIIIRRNLLNLRKAAPGKALYLAQAIMYSFCVIIGEMYVVVITDFEFGSNRIPAAILVSAILTVLTMCTAMLITKRNIKEGKYLHKNKISERIVAFSSSTGCLCLYLIALHIMRKSLDGAGYAVVSILIVQVAAVLSLMYFMKLRYAEKYGMEEYLKITING